MKLSLSEAPRPQGGASVAKPSETTPKPSAVSMLWRDEPGFALRASAFVETSAGQDAAVASRHLARPKPPAQAGYPRASARGILAKASKNDDLLKGGPSV